MNILKPNDWTRKDAHTRVRRMVDSHPNSYKAPLELKHYIMHVRLLRIYIDAFIKNHPGCMDSLNTNKLRFVYNIAKPDGYSTDNITESAKKVRDSYPETFGEHLKFDHFARCIVLNKKILDRVLKRHPVLKKKEELAKIMADGILKFADLSEDEV